MSYALKYVICFLSCFVGKWCELLHTLMFENQDPAKLQYLFFSFVISIIIGGILSFFFADLLHGPFVSGFPIDIRELGGVVKILAQLFNTFILGLLLTVPMYYLINWLQEKASGI